MLLSVTSETSPTDDLPFVGKPTKPAGAAEEGGEEISDCPIVVFRLLAP
jgi:hypothetical protein